MGYAALHGPITLEQAHLLVLNAANNTFGHNDDIAVRSQRWGSDIETCSRLGDDTNVPALYNRLSSTQRSYLASTDNVGVTVKCFFRKRKFFSESWPLEIRTRIVDRTAIDDLVSGQIIPARVRTIVVQSTYWEEDYYSKARYDQFIENRNKLIRQANSRMDQSIAYAAWFLINNMK